jgi:hypothetical protein
MVPSCPEYHMRRVPSASSRTQGRMALRLSGSPDTGGGRITPSRIHSTGETLIAASSHPVGCENSDPARDHPMTSVAVDPCA